jgi:hypothetical protein
MQKMRIGQRRSGEIIDWLFHKVPDSVNATSAIILLPLAFPAPLINAQAPFANDLLLLSIPIDQSASPPANRSRRNPMAFLQTVQPAV